MCLTRSKAPQRIGTSRRHFRKRFSCLCGTWSSGKLLPDQRLKVAPESSVKSGISPRSEVWAWWRLRRAFIAESLWNRGSPHFATFRVDKLLSLQFWRILAPGSSSAKCWPPLWIGDIPGWSSRVIAEFGHRFYWEILLLERRLCCQLLLIHIPLLQTCRIARLLPAWPRFLYEPTTVPL